MSDDSEVPWSWVAGLAVFAALLVGTVLGADCEDLDRLTSRAAQRCDVEGRRLGCVRDTAWYVGDSCSCSIHDGTRISYPRPE